MKENTPNTVSVKVSQTTYDELNEEQSRIRRETGRKPTFTALLDSAWKVAKSITKSGDGAATKPGSPVSTDVKHTPEPLPSEGTSVQSGLVQLWVRDSDYPTVRDLLRVLHSHKPGLAQAIKNNMHEFVWVDQAWNELAKHKSPLVSAEGARERGPRATPIDLQGSDGDRERRKGDAGPNQDLKDRARAVQDSKRERDSGKKNAPGETGTGS